MNTIKAKGRAVNKNEVEAQFVGKNLTVVGGMGLFRRFVKKLGVGEALEQSIELSPEHFQPAPSEVHRPHGEEDRRSECEPDKEKIRELYRQQSREEARGFWRISSSISNQRTTLS